MSTKLQLLLGELKELKRFDLYPDFNGELIKLEDLEKLITKYTETTPTYKPGDSVRVIANTGGHGFIIGSTVTLIHKSFTGVIEDWAVLGDWKGTPTQFILTENEEFEPIN